MTHDQAIQDRAAFELIRYANCREDACVLLEALAINKGDRCLSIASAGDNSLALLENARPAARLAYWNMLIPREVVHHWPDRVRPLQDLSESCFRCDKAFFYQAFHVDMVL